MQLAQFGPRLGAQLIHEHPARVLIGGQCFGLAAVAVQGKHQHGVQVLAQRVGRGHAFELGDDHTVTAKAQLSVDPQLRRLQPQLRQPRNIA